MKQNFTCLTHYYRGLKKYPHLYLLSWLLMLSPVFTQAQVETEPNDNYAQANTFAANTLATGSVCPDGDIDFWLGTIPEDGVVRVYIEATNTGTGIGYFYCEGFDIRQQNGGLFNKTVAAYVSPGAVSKDSVDLYCLTGGDSLYFKLSQYMQCFSYKLSYKMLSTPAASDVEPNNNFEEAILFYMQDTVRGHVGYIRAGVVADSYDYYKMVLPSDGRVKIYVEALNTGNGAGYFYLEGFDKRQENGPLFNKNVAAYSSPNSISKDSVELFCRSAGDTLYFRVSQAYNCFGYKISCRMYSLAADNDVEPNNNFEEAVSFNVNDTIKGHIGYVSGGAVTDTYDYFRSVLPSDGVVRVYVEATNTGNGNGYLYIDGYDQRKQDGILFSRAIASYSAPGSTTIDSVDLFCRSANDTFYFRISQAYNCFGYKLTYKMISLAADNDLENNDDFATAVPINLNEEKRGHIGYVAGGNITDMYDFYKTVLPHDGMIRVYVEATNTGNSNGYLYVDGFDGRRQNGSILSKSIATYSPPGSTVLDSTDVYCRAAGDSIYFRISQAYNCFGYRIWYKLFSNSTGDVGDNDSYETATGFNALQTVKGHIGYYNAGAADDVDYYRSLLPSDGTLRVYMKAVNTGNSNGYLFVDGYDSRKQNGSVFTRTVANASAPGAIINDTFNIHCRAIDSFYFKITNAYNCFSYELSYEMINEGTNSSKNDLESNNSFSEAIIIKENQLIEAHIGYASAGSFDAEDYYKTALPYNGTLRIYVEAVNTAGSGYGYLTLYGYDKNQNQVFNKYIANGLPANVSVFDTLNIYCQAADTFYFKIDQNYTCFSYKLRYEITLGADTTVKVCPGFTTDISGLYNVKPFSTVKYENLAAPGSPVDPTNVSNGSYRLSVYNGVNNCSRDTAIITVALHPKPNLGADTTVRKCEGYTFDIRNVYNTASYAMVNFNTTNAGSVETGTYTLVVTNEFGCMDTAVITVANYPQPVAGFTVNTNTQCVNGNSFTFTNASTIATGTMTYQWDFGDNSFGSGSNPVHTYSGAGVYMVKLVATSDNGCIDSISKSVTVFPKPTPGFTMNNADQCLRGNSYSFTNTSSITFGTLTYTWQFGDNSSSSNTNPTHVYASAGSYSVKLIVTSENGCKDSIMQTVNVNANPDLGADEQVYLACAATTTDITTIYNTSGYASVNFDTNTPTAVLVGVYRLIVTNSSGCSDTAYITVNDASQQILTSNGSNTKFASRECTGTDGWTNYYHDNGTPGNLADDILLLSLKKNGNNIGTLGDGTFQVKNVATAGAGSNSAVLVTNPLMNSPNGFYAMNRYWQVTVTQQPTSIVGVKFYFTSQDVADVNGSYPPHNAVPDQFTMYKVVDGNPDPSTNMAGAQNIISLMPDAQPTITTWKYLQLNSNSHVAEFAVESFSGGGGGMKNNAQVLPVKLLSFHAIVNGENVETSWVTSEEINSSHFIVQRSSNGVHYENIGRLTAAGNSAQKITYQFTDVNVPWTTGTFYYRLQMVDKDGKEGYSSIVALRKDNRQLFTLMPNPAQSYIIVNGKKLRQLMISDNAGRKVMEELLRPGNSSRVDIAHLARGTYIVTVIDESGNRVSQALVVQ